MKSKKIKKEELCKKINDIDNKIRQENNKVIELTETLKYLENAGIHIKDNYKWYEIKQKHNKKNDIETKKLEVEQLISESKNKIQLLENEKKSLGSNKNIKTGIAIAGAIIIALAAISSTNENSNNDNTYSNSSQFFQTEITQEQTSEDSTNVVTIESIESKEVEENHSVFNQTDYSEKSLAINNTTTLEESTSNISATTKSATASKASTKSSTKTTTKSTTKTTQIVTTKTTAKPKSHVATKGTPKPTVRPPSQNQSGSNLVWVPINGGTKYHTNSSCSKMKNPVQIPQKDAISRGYGPCGKCYK